MKSEKTAARYVRQFFYGQEEGRFQVAEQLLLNHDDDPVRQAGNREIVVRTAELSD